jgi:hypothetical protein
MTRERTIEGCAKPCQERAFALGENEDVRTVEIGRRQRATLPAIANRLRDY